MINKSQGHGWLVKRLRRRPLTAETGVRFPYGLFFLPVWRNWQTHMTQNHAGNRVGSIPTAGTNFIYLTLIKALILLKFSKINAFIFLFNLPITILILYLIQIISCKFNSRLLSSYSLNLTYN